MGNISTSNFNMDYKSDTNMKKNVSLVEEESHKMELEEEEDKNAFECDDCNFKGIDCYEELGLTKEESIIYMDLGEPDRCEDCFDKWKNTSDAADYLKQTEESAEKEEDEEDNDYTCGSCGTKFDYKLNKLEYKENSPDDECSFCGTKFDDKWSEQYKSFKKNDEKMICEVEEEEEETKWHLVTPLYKKSVYEDIIHTKWYGGTRVSLKITKIWRYGEFNIELTDSESKEIVKLNEVDLNKYYTEVVCTDNLYDYDAEVIDIDKYDEELQKQINLDVFEDADNESPYDEVELVDEHDWEVDDTLYSIVGGVELDKDENNDAESEDESEAESEDETQPEDETIVYLNTVGGKIVGGSVEPPKEDKNEEPVKLCVNMNCERYPPHWDFEVDTEENYEDGQQWVKCAQCVGYYNDDGICDILFVQEEPNNQEAECDLCGKTEDIVQMKGSGQYLCGDGCDESGDESGDDDENEENYNYNNDEDNENLKGVEKEKINNCDVCCKDKSFEEYYVFKRGKQEMYSCVKCWENRKTQVVGESSWTWSHHTFPGPAYYTVNKEEEEQEVK